MISYYHCDAPKCMHGHGPSDMHSDIINVYVEFQPHVTTKIKNIGVRSSISG